MKGGREFVGVRACTVEREECGGVRACSVARKECVCVFVGAWDWEKERRLTEERASVLMSHLKKNPSFFTLGTNQIKTSLWIQIYAFLQHPLTCSVHHLYLPAVIALAWPVVGLTFCWWCLMLLFSMAVQKWFQDQIRKKQESSIFCRMWVDCHAKPAPASFYVLQKYQSVSRKAFKLADMANLGYSKSLLGE